MGGNRSAGSSAMAGTPCRTYRNAARAFCDVNLVPLEAQGPIPALLDSRADAGDNRGSCIWTSSTSRFYGSPRTWSRIPGMLSVADWRADAGDERGSCSCVSSTARPSGAPRTWRRRYGMPSVGGTACASLGDVRLLPSVGTGRNRSAGVVPCQAAPGIPWHTSHNAARRPLGDANWAPLQAQGRLPSLADLRADAADKRAACICSSSTGCSNGAAQAGRCSRGM